MQPVDRASRRFAFLFVYGIECNMRVTHGWGTSERVVGERLTMEQDVPYMRAGSL